MSVHVPFLDLDGRVRYLYERDYFPDGTLTDAHRVQLVSIWTSERQSLLRFSAGGYCV